MITTKGRYALRFMIDLAEQQSERPIPLDDISMRQGISKKYLEIVVKTLVKEKLVKGASGKGGGYRLLREPKDYRIGEILEAAEGSLSTVACLQKDAELCPRMDNCKTLPLWSKYDNLVHDFFYGVTLEDVIKGNV